MIASSPGLSDIEPMSQALADVAAVGLEGLAAGSSDQSPADDWLPMQLARLQAASESHGQTELVIVEPITRLICAAAGPAGETAAGCQPEEESPKPSEH